MLWRRRSRRLLEHAANVEGRRKGRALSRKFSIFLHALSIYLAFLGWQYAPRDKQLPTLCKTAPESVCDPTYGLSIARGSFVFPRGAWTTLKQTVTLNTPGIPDGSFTLEVDGQEIIHANGVYFQGPANNDGVTSGPESDGDDGADDDDDDGSGLLSGILDGILRRRAPSLSDHQTRPLLVTPSRQVVLGFPRSGKLDGPTLQLAQKVAAGAAGFRGLFFSTFFGGHDQSWESPRDQFVWFSGFEIAVA